MIQLRALVLPLAFLLPGVLSAQEEKPEWPILTKIENGEPLPGTALLTAEGDPSHGLVSTNDAFLDARIAAAKEVRDAKWKSGAWEADERRTRLAALLGLDRDARVESPRLEYYSLTGEPRGVFGDVAVHMVRWNAIDGIEGEGLLLEPRDGTLPLLADVIAIPDADQSPEELAGLGGDDSFAKPYALLLAAYGCRVLVPAVIPRHEIPHGMTEREWLHRPAFELGRHLLGYEQHIVLAGVTALEQARKKGETDRPLGVIGWGGGGLHALYAAALEPRIDAACVSGYFGPRDLLWKEPAEHNVFGLLETFGDAEIAALVAPRPLVIEHGAYPLAGFRSLPTGELDVMEERPPKRGKPGRFQMHTANAVEEELKRLRGIAPDAREPVVHRSDEAFGGPTLAAFAKSMGISAFDPMRPVPQVVSLAATPEGHDHAGERLARLAAAIERHHQRALVDSRQDRKEYFSELKTDSLENFAKTVEPYRDRFRAEVIGDFGLPLAPANARTRPYEEGPKTVSYEVVLDVFDESHGADGVVAYGILTLPRNLDLASGERRPVVVCQHGLEGTPQDVIGEPKYKAYKAFATRLAERGFITFAPQNGYKYFDLFRLQQFKAQSIGKTLFSLIIPQHQQITGWLAEQPFVDPDRIAFYGLSYGGKSAMRIPPLVDRYCLSICSADFNEWVWKNAATDEKSLRYSYANKGEYEIFEWNLGGTFNYAEMAALICPRPLMVERGHFDGVAPDETVAYEFAKVRHLYQAQLGIGDRCEIEWFVGPHSINGVGAYDFLHRHLGWEER